MELVNQDPTLLYDFVTCVGKGSYGKVYRAESRVDRKTVVAFKVIRLDDGEQSISIDTQRELTSLRQCQHDHVVQYYGAYLCDNRLWISMEFCLCSMHAVLRHINQPFSEAQIAAVCSEALAGLRYLHSEQQIVHRDVKAGNILISAGGQIKLADFGVSARVSDTLTKRNTVIGTPMWMSPEMIEAGQYDHRTDIWSLGITAIELAQMRPPLWDVQPPVRVLFLIPSKPPPQLEHPEHWSAEFRDFVERCLTKDPALRPDSLEAMAHAFFDCMSAQATEAELLQLVGRYRAAERQRRTTAPSPAGGSTMESTLKPSERCDATLSESDISAGQPPRFSSSPFSLPGSPVDINPTLLRVPMALPNDGDGGSLGSPSTERRDSNGDVDGERSCGFSFMQDYDFDIESELGDRSPLGAQPAIGSSEDARMHTVELGTGMDFSSRDFEPLTLGPPSAATGHASSRLPESPPSSGHWDVSQEQAGQQTLDGQEGTLSPVISQVGLLKSGGWEAGTLAAGGPLLVDERNCSAEMCRPRRHSELQPISLPPAEAAESAPTHRRNKSHSSITNNMKGLVTTLKNRLGTPRNSNHHTPAPCKGVEGSESANGVEGSESAKGVEGSESAKVRSWKLRTSASKGSLEPRSAVTSDDSSQQTAVSGS